VKCLDVSTYRVYIFKDVAFDENTFSPSHFPSCNNDGDAHVQDHMIFPTILVVTPLDAPATENIVPK
jgi:hypothetical protein